jgi:hypothetical protein
MKSKHLFCIFACFLLTLLLKAADVIIVFLQLFIDLFIELVQIHRSLFYIFMTQIADFIELLLNFVKNTAPTLLVFLFELTKYVVLVAVGINSHANILFATCITITIYDQRVPLAD